MAHLHTDDLLRAKVVRAVDRRALPKWLSELAEIEVYDALQTIDCLRDGCNIALGVRIGGHALTMVGFIDFNSGGALKDGFAVPDSLAGFATMWESIDTSAAITSRRITPADGRAWLGPAIEIGAHTWPPFESDSWPQARPLLEWVLRHCPSGGAGFDRPDLSEREQLQLVSTFLAAEDGRPFAADRDFRLLLDSLMWFGTGYGYGDPLLLSPTKIEILLLDWVPRKIVGDPAYLAKLPDLLAAFIPYGHRLRGIPASLTLETLEALDSMQADYLAAIRSPRLQGPLALLAQAGLLGSMDTEDFYLSALAGAVGGVEPLDLLDADPLPDEPLDLTGIPDDVHQRVERIGDLCDDCCAALFDRAGVEHRTAVRRLLHDVALGDPEIFRRRSKDETAAAALCWLVGGANSVMARGGVTTKALMAHFGLTGSPSQRAEPMRRAAHLPGSAYEPQLGSPRYLSSQTRQSLVERRDRARARMAAE